MKISKIISKLEDYGKEPNKALAESLTRGLLYKHRDTIIEALHIVERQQTYEALLNSMDYSVNVAYT